MEPRAESGRIRPGAKNKKGAVCKQGEREAVSSSLGRCCSRRHGSPFRRRLFLSLARSLFPPSFQPQIPFPCPPAPCSSAGKEGGRAGKGLGKEGIWGRGEGCLLFCNQPPTPHTLEEEEEAAGWGGGRRGAPAFLPPAAATAVAVPPPPPPPSYCKGGSLFFKVGHREK